MANKNRDKGHRYERWWANIFKDLGWEKCITARQGSRIMDDSGIDLINIPYNMQLKYGYPRGINYKTLFDSIDACKEKNFMDDDKVHAYPTVIAHKKSTKSNEHFVVMKAEDWIELIKRVEDINQRGTDDKNSELYKDLTNLMQKYN
jgi:hypothetical protein